MDYEKLRTTRNEKNSFANYLGISVRKVREGYAEAVVVPKKEYMNPIGVVHGGCIYTLADIAASYAVAAYGYNTVTTSGEYHYLNAAKGNGELRAEATTVEYGRKFAYTDVKVFADGDQLIGKGTFVHYILKTKIFEGEEM